MLQRQRATSTVLMLVFASVCYIFAGLNVSPSLCFCSCVLSCLWNLAARHLFKGLRKLFCSFASTLTTWSYPKLLFHFSNSPLSSLFSLLDHCCSLSLSFCSFTNSTQLQHNDRHICWCSYIHIPAPTKKKNPAFSHPSHHTWKPLVHYPADYWGLDFFFVPSCVNQDVSWECHM